MTQHGNTYVSLSEAKAQLRIDEGLTIHDAEIERLIGAAIDWAENYTNRSLGELMELDSPRDSSAVPLPDPKDSPGLAGFPANAIFPLDASFDWGIDPDLWRPLQWQCYYQNNPIQIDQSRPLRRDAHAAILIYMQVLFDRDPVTMDDQVKFAQNMIWPYRINLGV